jgi:uncharacterized protein
MQKVRCPICKKPMNGQGPREWPDWPFCSPRCKLIDLGRWLDGSYRVESPATADDVDDPEALARSPKPGAPTAVPDREEA